MAGLPDQRIHQKTTQSSTHNRGHSQASQARAVWSHMPHAGQQNIKDSVVWGGGRSQLPGTTKEALGRRHTEVVRHDTTTGVTSCTGSRDVEESHSWPLRFLNYGTRRRRRRRYMADKAMPIKTYYAFSKCSAELEPYNKMTKNNNYVKNNGLLKDKRSNVFKKCQTFENFLHRSRVRLLCHCTDSNNNTTLIDHGIVIIQVIFFT